MSKNSSIPGGVSSWLDKETQYMDEARQKGRFIKLALNFEDRRDSIPDWDVESLESLFETISPEEELALEYVADNDINLADYRPEAKSPAFNSEKNNLAPITLNNLLDKYIELKRTSNKKEKTLKMYSDNISLFIEIVNLNGVKKANSLTREHVNEYIYAMQKIPANRKKVREFRDKSLNQLLSMEIDASKLLSDNTRGAGATNVKAFLDWGIKNEYINEKVSIPLEDAFKNPVSYPYIAFTDNDLELLFTSKEYTLGTHKKAGHYWVPLIALYTGARSNEICQLYVEDIKFYEAPGRQTSIPYFDINDEDSKETKTKSSKRKIPIHPSLVKLGFLKFVENQKKLGHTQLFSDLNEKKGKFSEAFSMWFNEVYRPNCGVESIKPDKRKVFHSFRHTLTQNIRRNSNTSEDKIAEILGHASSSIVGKHYAGKLSIPDKYKVIKEVKYRFDTKKIRRWRN